MNPVEPRDSSALVVARHVSPYSSREKIGRVLWWFVQATVWRWSWHNFYGWRRWVLRRFGAAVAGDVRIRPSVRIECPWNLRIGRNSVVGDRAELYALGEITIGERVTVSQHAYLCAGTHDYTRPDLPLLRPPIVLHDDVWIAASAFVGPGVTAGAGAILGARAVAFKDLEPWTIYVGNPAKPVKQRPRSASEAPAGEPTGEPGSSDAKQDSADATSPHRR